MIKTHAAAIVALVLAVVANSSEAVSAPPQAMQSYDGYQSWLVACDNLLSCVAKGFNDTNEGAEIEIEREAGPEGSLVVSITADRPFTMADIRIDGKPAGLASSSWRMVESDGGATAVSSDFVAVRSFVQKLRNASKVTLGGADEVPLDGFAAAMLRLDERQGRVGSVTALARPGSLPASRIPGPPPLPIIPNHPISARLAAGEQARLIAAVRAGQRAVLEKEDCEETPQDPEAYALDAKRALVFLPCIMGAYQGSSLAFIASRTGGPAHRLIAPTPYLGNVSDRSEGASFTEASFDPETGTLGMAAKGRGLADCGISASWIWDGDAFRLSEMSLQRSCGGAEPGDWPVLFRSSQRGGARSGASLNEGRQK